MAARQLRIFGDPILRQRAIEVEDFDGSLRKLVEDMSDTMTEENGAGLAAPQIGVGLRVFVYGVDDEEDEDNMSIRHIVNPVLIEQSAEEIEDVEGCLSIPGLRYDLRRPRRIVAQGFNMYGDPITIEGTERVARALAHETDHLDGILFVDRLDEERRKEALREIRLLILDGENVVVKESPHS
ncbi:MAG: peptide deformylase [Acidimicrobiales bacterium]